MSYSQQFERSQTWTKLKDLVSSSPARRVLFERFEDIRVRVISDTVYDDLTGIAGAAFELRGIAREDDKPYSTCFHARTPDEFPFALGFACSNFARPPTDVAYNDPDILGLPGSWPWMDS